MNPIDMPISITESLSGDVLILKLKGRLDAISSIDAEKKVFEYIHKGHTKLVLDLSLVDYLSSAGLRMLLSVSKKLKTFSGNVILCSVTPMVMDILKMSGFDHVLELVQTPEEALKKF